MPEPNVLSLYSFSPEPPKKSPIIKLSCGIGDTDGFPAFDVDSEQYAAKDDSKWGFLITGGAEFHMPLTVFQVTPDGLADKGGICLGDIILEINEEDATQLTLAQAHEKINDSGKKIHFLVKSMDDEELMEGYEPGEERSIVLRVPKPPPPPKVSVIERRLQDLQRKLSEIAEIPKILSSTLATVSQTFDKLTTTLPTTAPPPLHCRHHFHGRNADCPPFLSTEQKRKLSYDEDVYDYELSDDDNKTEDDASNEEEFDAKAAYLQLKRYAARQRKSKEVTPESDYASESNFPQVPTQAQVAEDTVRDIYDDDDSDIVTAVVSADEEEEDTEQNCDMYEEFNLSVLAPPFGQLNSEDEEFDEDAEGEDDNEQDSEDDEDFLTTTFTWSLRNKPKPQLCDKDKDKPNDDDDGADADADANVDAENVGLLKLDNEQIDVADKDNVVVEQQKSLDSSQQVLSQKPATTDTPEKEQQKTDKLERSWPWADREKIIYKQSTCHLVPHKPLGLIEQRIQLLAKRNLLEHINRVKNPQ